MYNIFKKISYSIVIVFLICSFSGQIFATSISDLESQESEIQSKIDETSSEISGVQSEMTKALEDVSKVTNQISDCENNVLELENQISDLNSQIEEKEKNIREQQDKYDYQKNLLDKRLVAVYESGNTKYLDVLLSSSSLTDFISKYYFVEKIAQCDKDLLINIQNLKAQIETEKAELESNKNNYEINKRSEEIQRAALENLKKEKEIMVSKLTDEEKQLQSQLDEYEEDKKEVNREIAKAIEEENRRKAAEEAARKAREEAERKAEEERRLAEESSKKTQDNSESSSSNSNNNSSSNASTSSNTNTTSTTSTSGFICPLAGRTKNDITTGYHGYAGHTGVDFARNSKGPVAGLPVLAAKSGTVIISKALKNSNGDYRSYGEYIVISHSDGTLSLYAHMQPNSRLVSVGDYVTQGQQIGNVGTTGNSTGYHLHFEVRLSSGTIVNPTQYLP